MNWLKAKNNEIISTEDIPVLAIENLRREIIRCNRRPIGFFGKKEEEGTKLFVVLSDDASGQFFISSTLFGKEEKSYNSISSELPAFNIFEREFYEEFHIEPLGHPWLKPLRNHKNEYKFFEMQGEEVHQVAVGPIHAGIIEPGHFRFMCNGEKVYNLEIQLGYQHKNIEELFLRNRKNKNQLAESICGDSVIAHNLAYTNLAEALLDLKPTNKAQLIRLIALEMERIAVHVGDLGAIAGDIAYLMGNSVFGATRTIVINTMLEICGSRFGRGLICTGGVNFDIDSRLSEKINCNLAKVEKNIKRMTQTMINSASVISRLEKTGYLSRENAIELNIVGLVARASDVGIDSRFDFKNKWYLERPTSEQYRGDVLSRFKVRYNEILQSISFVKLFLKELEKYSSENLLVESNGGFMPNSFVVSILEGWRGEVVHTALTDDKGLLRRYKIKDPSFNNWYGLATAMRNNDISDFPLCNKSFNLSYCGNDL